MARKTLKIGLTGGIGSGKTTVANYFAKLGVPVIDADAIVHELLQPDTPEFRAIVKHFGKPVLSKRGELKRKLLRKIIFTNPEEKRWLEKLLHFKVYAEMQKRVKQVRFSYCILVIPLLFESVPPRGLIDRILVIDAYKTTQIKRIAARDKTTVRMVSKIIDNQISRKARLAKADDVITNNGSLRNLHTQIKKIHKKLSQVLSDSCKFLQR